MHTVHLATFTAGTAEHPNEALVTDPSQQLV
jgi:hypothetical protein